METCEETGVTTVRIDVTTAGLFDFPCTGYGGSTNSIPSGYYQIQVIAFDQNGQLDAAMEFQDVYAFGPTSLGNVELKIP
jgi:hypothetical protein